MVATKNIEDAILDCYRELFKASTPSADFDSLVENAWIDGQGLKHIPYNEYEIESDIMDNIIEDICKQYRIRKHLRSRFKNTIYLGCSPKRLKKIHNK